MYNIMRYFDMLVKLYELPDNHSIDPALSAERIRIHRLQSNRISVDAGKDFSISALLFGYEAGDRILAHCLFKLVCPDIAEMCADKPGNFILVTCHGACES